MVKKILFIIILILSVNVFFSCTLKLDYNESVSYFAKNEFIRLGSFPKSEVNEETTLLLESKYQKNELEKIGNYFLLNNKMYSRKVIINDYVEEDTSDDYFELFTQYKVGSIHWFIVEPIKWRVMNSQNGYVILFTNELIMARQYSSGENEKDWLWENSDLRKYLNGEFFNMAFSTEEKKLLIKTESPCYYISNPGRIKYERKSVEDYIRIPEWREMLIKEHFENDAERRSNVTDYARACGGACVSENALIYFEKNIPEYQQYIGSGIYWLMDTEYNSDFVYIVYEYGNVISYKRNVKNRTIRPVIVCKYDDIKEMIVND